jgi:hypothetical protein
MQDIQTVTIYYHVVYTLAAVIFGGYTISIVMAARRARARLEAAKH